MSSEKSTASTAAAGLLLAALVAGLFFLNRKAEDENRKPEIPKVVAPAGPVSVVDQLLADCLATNREGQRPDLLMKLRMALFQLPPQEASAWILGQLESGGDAATGSDLTIGSDQVMNGWPSVRVFLLDVLGQVDAAAGARAGRQTLGVPASPDEWAVAMRNVARAGNGDGDKALLKAKTGELLRNEAWRRTASAGYLQAFDVIVHIRHIALAPELLAFSADTTNRAVRHAAFLTLDRLVQAEPAGALPMLVNGAAPPETGRMISNMVARADVRDAAQRAAVEQWLASDQRTAAELQGFAGVFPNANQMVSHNLLTGTPAMDGSALAVQDRAALGVVEEWLSDPRFARAHELLRGTRERLRGFVTP